MTGSLRWDLQNAPLTIVEIASAKKFSKATQKGQKWKYHFNLFQSDIFEIFCIFGLLRYGFLNEISISELFDHFYFLTFMLWWAQCISDWFSLIASTEAWLRLRKNFKAWYDPFGSKECPHFKFGGVSLSNESVATFYIALYF